MTTINEAEQSRFDEVKRRIGLLLWDANMNPRGYSGTSSGFVIEDEAEYRIDISPIDDAERSWLDSGCELYYIVQNNTNHRFRDHDGDLYIYDNLDVAITKACALGWHGGCSPISVGDYMRKYGRFMDAEADE